MVSKKLRKEIWRIKATRKQVYGRIYKLPRLQDFLYLDDLEYFKKTYKQIDVSTEEGFRQLIKELVGK